MLPLRPPPSNYAAEMEQLRVQLTESFMNKKKMHKL